MILLPVKLHTSPIGLREGKAVTTGAETDMLDELLGKSKQDGFSIHELVTDKDSSVNATFCHYFLREH